MPKLINSLLFFLAVFATSACQEGSFNGEAQQARGGPAKLCTPTKTKKCEKVPTKPGNPWDPTDPNNPTNPINPTNPSLLSTDGGGVCLLKAPIIDFVFAMDVSGSMQDESDRVNEAFLTLADNLANITIPGLGKVEKVRFGLVTYEDSIIYQAPLNDNVANVKANISSNFRVRDGVTDFSEAGLFAAKTAMEMAKASGDSVKVLFLATDAYSHDGVASITRTYDQTSLVQTFAAPNMKLSFIFTASDPNGGSGNIFNIPPGTAQAQWTKVRKEAGVYGNDYNISNFSTRDVSNDIPIDIGKQLRKCN